MSPRSLGAIMCMHSFAYKKGACRWGAPVVGLFSVWHIEHTKSRYILDSLRYFYQCGTAGVTVFGQFWRRAGWQCFCPG